MDRSDSAIERVRRVERLAASLDVTDEMRRQRQAETLVAALNEARGAHDAWPAPVALPELPPVDSFDDELLPPVLGEVARDIADRMQCPVDYVAVALVILIAAAVGRRPSMRNPPQAA